MERAETRQEPTEHGSGSGELQFEIDRDLIGTVNADGYFTSLNAAWERVLGWSREELMQRPFIDFVHPDDVARTAREALKVDLPDYQLVNFENRYRTKDGHWRWLRWSARSDGETWFAVAFDVTERKLAEARLRGLLTAENLLAYTQPILDAQGGALVQEELLARVRSPGDGRMIILPEGFVPAAERHGLIGLVDQQMLSEGVRLANRGRYAEVNLSAQSICDESLTLAVERVLIQAGESAERIVFEITESDAIHHLDAARDFADRMVRLGCRFALDDFGTGYGSLTYLRHLPVRFLKIDTTFVRDLTRSSEDQAMVRSIVAIAKEFGLRTVAEGVEDALTLKLLREYGVHNVQGYLMGRPRPIAETAAVPS
ncbi:MAG TPA: EAL domain-containing protein [Solirubrobacterales bacterium]|nr:EAL domain-containing protein [Solirubrobacterales bacterium]